MKDVAVSTRVDPCTLDIIKDRAHMFLHYKLGSRQAGAQLVTDVLETLCCHIFSEETVRNLRRMAASTHSGIMECPECKRQVHCIVPIPSLGGLSAPSLVPVPELTTDFEAALTQFSVIAPAAAPAAAGPSTSFAAPAAAPTAAEILNTLPTIDFAPATEEEEEESEVEVVEVEEPNATSTTSSAAAAELLGELTGPLESADYDDMLDFLQNGEM